MLPPIIHRTQRFPDAPTDDCADQRALYGFYLGVYEALLYAIAGGKTSAQSTSGSKA